MAPIINLYSGTNAQRTVIEMGFDKSAIICAKMIMNKFAGVLPTGQGAEQG